MSGHASQYVGTCTIGVCKNKNITTDNCLSREFLGLSSQVKALLQLNNQNIIYDTCALLDFRQYHGHKTRQDLIGNPAYTAVRNP